MVLPQTAWGQRSTHLYLTREGGGVQLHDIYGTADDICGTADDICGTADDICGTVGQICH